MPIALISSIVKPESSINMDFLGVSMKTEAVKSVTHPLISMVYLNDSRMHELWVKSSESGSIMESGVNH